MIRRLRAAFRRQAGQEAVFCGPASAQMPPSTRQDRDTNPGSPSEFPKISSCCEAELGRCKAAGVPRGRVPIGTTDWVGALSLRSSNRFNSPVVLTVWVALALACAGAEPARSPLDALDHYVAAVRARDAAGAYAWLSAAAKQTLSFEEFQRLLLSDPQQAEELEATLGGPGKVQEIRAEVVAENGEVLTLTFEDGGWKADLDSIDIYSQSTPLRTLKSFIRAFDRERFEILVRFVPSDQASGLTPAKLKQAWTGETRREMDVWVQALRRALPFAQAEVIGDRASVAYGENAHVELVKEAGVWKIEAL